jgi:hypothetical protein
VRPEKINVSPRCDCSNPAYRRKHGEWVCARCDRLEAVMAKLAKPPMTREELLKHRQAIRKPKTFQYSEPQRAPGLVGIVIEGAGVYAI